MANTTAQPTGDQGNVLRRLIDVGIALSAEKDHNKLMERILVEAKAIYNADGGTFYLRQDDRLSFAIMRNDSMGIALGGTTGNTIPFPPLDLHDPESGQPNHQNVATHVALDGLVVNIADAYKTDKFDFSGARRFDEQNGYRSASFLTLPLKNYEGIVVGVLQLINARDADGNTVAFDPAAQSLVEALAGQAAVALDNRLLLEAQKALLESFVQLIAIAIDRKSPYTSGHCQRVPVLTEMLAQAACDATDGPFSDFDLDDETRYELHMAAWMHDCGKVTTPESVMDKSTKLETIFDRIDLVRTRFASLRNEAEIAYLRDVASGAPELQARADRDERLARLADDLKFLESANIGGEYMDVDKIERVRRLAVLTWEDWNGDKRPLLSDDEVKNLSIPKGTLTPEERKIINDHIVVTIDMLEQLPFPRNLRRVPEFAGGHHEKMDGTGYPRGLTRDQMSVPARMMAIADIYEALTAADRPYKKPMTLSQSLRIMKKMCNESHIDPDLFQLFVEAGVYQKYAEAHLLPEQIDEVPIDEILGEAA
ncbi:MAG: GAF domain-containing protein [Proteobacteria bacterium]|nr:GAF domain-containing protein [Pseudomonadota bacterium]